MRELPEKEVLAQLEEAYPYPFGSSLWLKLPFRFKILHPAHKRVSRVVGLGRSGSSRVALGS